MEDGLVEYLLLVEAEDEALDTVLVAFKTLLSLILRDVFLSYWHIFSDFTVKR